MVDAINPPGVWPAFGAFSMAVLQGDGHVVHLKGHVVHLKGQVALDRSGQIVGPGDMRAQVRQALDNIASVLSSMGGQMGDVMALVHYATDIEQFMAAGDIRRAYFAEPYPVTTTVQVSRLYHPDLLIEISAIAEIPRDRFQRPPIEPGDAP